MATDWEKDIADGFGVLSKAAFEMTEATKGLSCPDERFVHAGALFFKFYGHVSSAYSLYQMHKASGLRKQLTGVPHDFFEQSSIAVLCRAAWEAFLTFHFVYVAPKTPEERDCRYWSWLLAALLTRQKFTTTSPENQQKLDSEKILIEEFRDKLRRNKYFYEQLRPNQRKGVLKDGSWRVGQSWREMAEEAGFNDRHGREMYSFLCDYAHSGNLSVFQIRAGNFEIAKDLSLLCLRVMLITFANFVAAYAYCFPQTGLMLDVQQYRETIEFWCSLGRDLPNSQ